jgi:hypothetical protein
MAVWEAIAKLNTIVGAMAGRTENWTTVVENVNTMIDRVDEFVYVLVGERYNLLKKFENISLDSNGGFINKGEWNTIQGILETFISGPMVSGNPFREIKTELTNAREKVRFGR